MWVFDAQGVAGGTATWFWDPLSYVDPRDPEMGRARRLPSGLLLASETRADRLAAQLVTSARPVGAQINGYFDLWLCQLELAPP